MKKIASVCFILLICFVFFGSSYAKSKTLKLESPVFQNGHRIPKRYTCDGEDISPPLKWEGVPKGTKSFVLICDDPDAPMGTWVHWVYYNIPKEVRSLPENILPEENPAIGGTQGLNDFKKIGYGGPCPPWGTHRYFFKLYALDDMLDLPAGLTKDQLMKIIQGHIIDKAVLMGIYSR